MQRFQSWARWPHPEVQLGNTLNESTDEHLSEQAAWAVVQGLRREGFGGEGRVFPLESGVRPL